MKEISRQLYSRSMHRMFGHPQLGTVTAFLTVIFIIRSAANLYFVQLISAGTASIMYRQISNGWFIYMGAYFIACSSLSAFHTAFALPKNCFISDTAAGKDFRLRFIRHAAVVRPMNIIMLTLSAAGVFIFSSTSGNAAIALSACIIITVSIFASFILFRFIEKLRIGMLEIQLIETLLLVFLVLINPDVINIRGYAELLLYGFHIPFDSVITVIISLLFIILLFILLILTAKAVWLINRIFHRRRSSIDPFLSWYFHSFKISYWFFLYLIIIPVTVSDIFSKNLQFKAVAGYLIFTSISWLIFILNCSNVIRYRFRSRLLSANRIKLTAVSAVFHLGLTVFPLLFAAVAVFLF